MNEPDQPIQPPNAAASPELELPPVIPPPKPPRPLSWWLRKLFACNPFYILSAALLLFGCYRVSIDAPAFSSETARLLFNFSAIQVYEVLLVGTAVFLARRAIWYDATLLVGLENLLVFVPFIFISLAALTDSRMALAMCVAGGAVAVMRFGSLKRYFIQLNLSGTSLGIGFVLLALNIALPLIYRSYGEHIIGAYINSGPAHAMNLRVWLFGLPAAVALANLLPRVEAVGTLLPQRRWLPIGLFSLWIIVTGLHLYSLGYIYQFDFGLEQMTPALLVLAWTIYWQANRNVPELDYRVKYALALLPVFVPLLASAPQSGNATFLTLAMSNAVVYGGLCLYERAFRLARHLLFASSVMFIAGLPGIWLQVAGLSHAGVVGIGMVLYLVFWTVMLRDPKLAVMTSLVLGCAVASVLENYANAVHLGFQTGFAFLLLHSLRWNDAEHQGAKVVRVLTGLAWVAESFLWMNAPAGKFWMPCISGTAVLGTYFAVQMLCQNRSHVVVPAAAILVILSGPCNVTADGAYSLPIGVLAVIGSFLLFALGTVAALTRHLWHKNGHNTDTAPPEIRN